MKGPLPDNIISKMDPKDRPKGWMSGEEAQRKYQRGEEKKLHEHIISFLEIGQFYYEHERMDKPPTGEKGRPDFRICVRGRFLAVECKAKGETPDEAQRARHGLLCANGGHLVVAYDLETVIRAVRRLEHEAYLQERYLATTTSIAVTDEF